MYINKGRDNVTTFTCNAVKCIFFQYFISPVWSQTVNISDTKIPIQALDLLFTPIHIGRLILVQFMSHFVRLVLQHEWLQEFLQYSFTIIWYVNTSLARCMYAYVNTQCEHTGDPLQSRFKEIQSLALTMLVIVDVCQVLSCCKSTYFMLRHHFQWSYFSVYMLHTGPPLPDLLLTWPQHQGRELCVQHTPLAQHCMAWWHAYVAISIHLPWKWPPPDLYWLLFGNPGQVSV